jgi:hypothetical protein
VKESARWKDTAPLCKSIFDLFLTGNCFYWLRNSVTPYDQFCRWISRIQNSQRFNCACECMVSTDAPFHWSSRYSITELWFTTQGQCCTTNRFIPSLLLLNPRDS